MAWGWAEVDEVLLRLLWVWRNLRKLCGAALLSAHYIELWGSPLFSSIVTINHLCACHNLSVYPATKNKWQQGLVWLHLRVGFSCDTSFSTAYCYSLAISLFPHKYLIWASAIIPTQQQRSPRISKAISFPLKCLNLFPHHLQGSIEYTALSGDILGCTMNLRKSLSPLCSEDIQCFCYKSGIMKSKLFPFSPKHNKSLKKKNLSITPFHSLFNITIIDQLLHSKTFCWCIFSRHCSADEATARLSKQLGATSEAWPRALTYLSHWPFLQFYARRFP